MKTDQHNTAQAAQGDQSLRRAGVIAGSALLLMIALSVYAYGVAIGGLVANGDAAQTASNIAQAEGSFRIGVACFALIAILDVVIAWGLRVVFAPVSEIVSGLAAAARVAYAAVLLVATGHLVVASQLLSGPEGRAGFSTPELQAQGSCRSTPSTPCGRSASGCSGSISCCSPTW